MFTPAEIFEKIRPMTYEYYDLRRQVDKLRHRQIGRIGLEVSTRDLLAYGFKHGFLKGISPGRVAVVRQSVSKAPARPDRA
jgi:hypothetical protein